MTSAAEAQQLLQQGRVGEAERAFAAVLESDPDNVQALNFTGMAALQRGDLTAAEQTFRRAVTAAPGDALTQHNFGRVMELAKDYDAAARAQRAALRAAPQFHAARLFLGRVLEAAGDHHGATIAYARALQDAQREGRWLDKATTPAAFQALVANAVYRVRYNRLETIERLLQPVIAKHGNEPLRRFEKSLRVFFNAEPTVVLDPRQQSRFFHYPDIPATPYLDRALFPWIEEFESKTDAIRQELLALLPDSQGREAVFASAALEASHLRGGLAQPPSWNGYYFYRYGERRDENCLRCPQTAAALDKLPLCRVRKHGPEVLFSVFTPGTHLLPHRGVTNTRVVGHLPLMVPSDCALVVGGEEHRWQEGKVVVFDDTFEHEAWNRSDTTRVVLIFDLWSPFLSEAECDALAVLIDDIGAFNMAVETAD